MSWLHEVPPTAFSVTPPSPRTSVRLTAVLVGLYANLLTSGGLSAVPIVVPVNLLRSAWQTVDAMGVYANVPRSGWTLVTFAVVVLP